MGPSLPHQFGQGPPERHLSVQGLSPLPFPSPASAFAVNAGTPSAVRADQQATEWEPACPTTEARDPPIKSADPVHFGRSSHFWETSPANNCVLGPTLNNLAGQIG